MKFYVAVVEYCTAARIPGHRLGVASGEFWGVRAVRHVPDTALMYSAFSTS